MAAATGSGGPLGFSFLSKRIIRDPGFERSPLIDDSRQMVGQDLAVAVTAAVAPMLRRSVLLDIAMHQFPMTGGAGAPITIILTFAACEVPPLTPVIVNG